MNLNNRVKNRFEISEILKKLLVRLKKVESNLTNTTIPTSTKKEAYYYLSQNGPGQPVQYTLIKDEIGLTIGTNVYSGVGNYLTRFLYSNPKGIRTIVEYIPNNQEPVQFLVTPNVIISSNYIEVYTQVYALTTGAFISNIGPNDIIIRSTVLKITEIY